MSSESLTLAHRQFEAALPVIHRSVRYLLRHRRHDRDELLAEIAARAWKTWCGLIAHGRDPIAVGVTAIAAWAARHALKGRRIGNRSGGRGAMDVFCRRAQAIRRFRIVSYDASPVNSHSRPADGWRDWMVVNHRVSPADTACFRIDFVTWLRSLPTRMRTAAELLAAGHGTAETAALCNISSARVSQLRRELHRSWLAFQGEVDPPRPMQP